MSNRDLIKRVMTKAAAVQKTAAFPSSDAFPPEDGGDMDGGDGSSLTAKRNIPKDHPFDPKALKPMAQTLWASSVALGHALTAYKHLSRLKSATVSPDGMLGGRGFVMGVPDIRKKLYAACEALSTITDTLHDEITAPHWRPRLAMLDENDAEDIERYVEKSEGILDDPTAEAEEEEGEIDAENDGDEVGQDDSEEAEASSLPGGSGTEVDQAKPMTRSKEASYNRQSNSSVSPAELGGPRVEHLDRQDQPEPEMAYDGWGHPSMIEHQPYEQGAGYIPNRYSDSAMPGALTEPTPTDAYDFGLGYGARGEGAGGYGNPSGEGAGNKGVYGPTSGLPGAPAGSSGDTTPEFDAAVSDRHAAGELPNDGDRPVARSDYYRGDDMLAQSDLPGEPTPAGQMSPSMMNTDYTYEDLETPYVRYDYSTHTYRPDPIHNRPEKTDRTN